MKRRFEYVLKNSHFIMIDDYAHHPEELRALLNGVKELFPGRKCTIIFQPHLFSRTRDLADGFASVLSEADEIVLLPIYPAREIPMEGVTSAMIKEKMTNPNVRLMNKEELKDWVKTTALSVLITAGAGDIDMLIEPIKKILKEKPVS